MKALDAQATRRGAFGGLFVSPVTVSRLVGRCVWHGPAGHRHSAATLNLRSCVMNPIDLIPTSVARDAQGTVKARRILDRCLSAPPSHGMQLRLRLRDTRAQ